MKQLHVYLTIPVEENNMVFHASISSDKVELAKIPEIYQSLWHPNKTGTKKAWQLVSLLQNNIRKQLEMGYGNYDNDTIEFIAKYLSACNEFPDADIKTEIEYTM